MRIMEVFFPDELQKSAYELPFTQWYQAGYKGIIFDIDNTLVPHGAAPQKETVQLFDKLRSLGFHTILLSNNREERVRSFAEVVGSPYIAKAGKPAAKNYLRAMDKMETMPENTLFVGDQLFTDIWGAKKLGIHTILVQRIDPKEEIQIVLKRYLERIVLHYYHKNR